MCFDGLLLPTLSITSTYVSRTFQHIFEACASPPPSRLALKRVGLEDPAFHDAESVSVDGTGWSRAYSTGDSLSIEPLASLSLRGVRFTAHRQKP